MHANNPNGHAAADTAQMQEARRYVKRLRDFYQLVLVALLVIALSAVVNWLKSPGHWWVQWVVLGFGIAIAFSALDTFGRNLWLGRAWQDRKAREYIDRHGA